MCKNLQCHERFLVIADNVSAISPLLTDLSVAFCLITRYKNRSSPSSDPGPEKATLMDKVVISNVEVAEVGEVPQGPKKLEPKLPPEIPWWGKATLSIFVLVLPLLCLIAIILRVSLRNQPPRTKHAVLAYLSTLLVVSGLITSLAIMVMFSLAPPPAMDNSGLSELDERTQFPKLPSISVLSSADVSQELKPLVVVISPAAKIWFGRQDEPANSLGAGALLDVDSNGRLKGLYVSPSGEILERDTHLLEVNLTLDYPRRAPQCRMLTPIFHPNFDETSVCIGDFWAASEGLDDLIIRIGRMIAYQEYNTKSPLNGLAAKWAAEHAHLLPIDSRNISPVSEAQTLAPSLEPAGEVLATEAKKDDPWGTKIVIQ
jgi:ubiquitin-protein ligase